jgi:hypothetical protein
MKKAEKQVPNAAVALAGSGSSLAIEAHGPVEMA